jgi:hypothetical protein
MWEERDLRGEWENGKWRMERDNERDELVLLGDFHSNEIEKVIIDNK